MEYYIKLSKTKAKQPFRWQLFAKNGEQLSNPENFTRKENAVKNIIDHIKAFHGEMILVEDWAWDNVTDTKPNIGNGPFKYWLYPDGSTSVFE